MTAEGYSPTSCPSSLALESKLSRSLEAQHGLVTKLSHHGGINHRPAGSKTKSDSSRKYHIQLFVNTVRSGFSVELSDTMFWPLMMFAVARQRVMMAGLVLRACTQAKSHDSSTMLEEQNIIRGVFQVFVSHF